MADQDRRNDSAKTAVAATNPKLESVALELFKARSAAQVGNPRQLAIGCFRDAKAFLATTERVLAGELDVSNDETNPLDIAFAPNLKRTHPINLMSREWGDFRKVQAALAELESDPAAEFYEPYSWGKPEVNQARALFPAVADRACQFANSK